MLATGKPDREIGATPLRGQHRERQKRVAAQLFEAAGIGWDDKAQRQDWTMRGSGSSTHPCRSSAVSIAQSRRDRVVLRPRPVHYAMVLAAWDGGVGAVINGQGIMQSSVVREEASIPDDQMIVITVAMGYPLDDLRRTMSCPSAAPLRRSRPTGALMTGHARPLRIAQLPVQPQDACRAALSPDPATLGHPWVSVGRSTRSASADHSDPGVARR